MNVIFHVDEIEKWDLTIANIKNMLVYSKENHERFHIVVLANSQAVECLSHRIDDYQAIMEKLSEDGILIYACHASLLKMGISNSELYSFVEVVPSGVVELAKKQAEGYAYIKA